MATRAVRFLPGGGTTHRQAVRTADLARHRGWEVVGTINSVQQLLPGARSAAFEVVVAESPGDLLCGVREGMRLLLELHRLGVAVAFVEPSALDTSGESNATSFLAALADLDRDQARARSRAGLREARRLGIRIGRPPKAIDGAEALRLRREGLSIRQIANRMGVGAATLHRALRAAQETA